MNYSISINPNANPLSYGVFIDHRWYRDLKVPKDFRDKACIIDLQNIIYNNISNIVESGAKIENVDELEKKLLNQIELDTIIKTSNLSNEREVPNYIFALDRLPDRLNFYIIWEWKILRKLNYNLDTPKLPSEFYDSLREILKCIIDDYKYIDLDGLLNLVDYITLSGLDYYGYKPVYFNLN